MDANPNNKNKTVKKDCRAGQIGVPLSYNKPNGYKKCYPKVNSSKPKSNTAPFGTAPSMKRKTRRGKNRKA
jgi:hypothetical protein